MCIPVKSSKPPPRENHPDAYRIYRLDHTGDGSHDRRYSSVERHLRAAPDPDPTRHRKHYPKQYENRGTMFLAASAGTYYEYPTSDYPYANQNSRGKARKTSPGRISTIADPMYTHTITDPRKNIQGVVYHPYGDRVKHVRAEEIYPAGPSKGRRR